MSDKIPMPSNVTVLKIHPSSAEDNSAPERLYGTPSPPQNKPGFFRWMKMVFAAPQKSDTALREAIEELIEEPENLSSDPVTLQERVLFSNILNLRDVRVHDIMVPRADIAALDVETSSEDLLKFLSTHTHSRFPVYKDTLDEILGSVHLKDIVSTIAAGRSVDLKNILTDAPIVSPAMPVLDLLLAMRKTRRHMALVVDEYGGIDGLVTVGDVIESIVGEIDDEHDLDAEPALSAQPDGNVLADGRVTIEAFEEKFGNILSEEERQDSDTLGGLVFGLAGRVPARGEIIAHRSGMEFEITDSDTRKIKRMKIRNIPGAGQ